MLGVSVSGFNQYRARQKQAAGEGPSPAQPGSGLLSDMALLLHIRAIFFAMKGAYMSPMAFEKERRAEEGKLVA